MNKIYSLSLSNYVPELFVIGILLLVIVLDILINKKNQSATFIYATCYTLLAGVLATLIYQFNEQPISIFYDALMIDKFSSFTKILLVAGTIGSIFIGGRSKDIYGDLKTDYLLMILCVLFGGMILASASNLLTIYLGIETLSIVSYVLASFKKYDYKSNESGLKYALYGGITAGIMLFGMSYIYGITGSIQLDVIAKTIQNISGFEQIVLIISLLFFFVGLGYKIACFPFHMWAPDVYQGSPIAVTAFFSIVPKLAGIAVMVRVTTSLIGANEAVEESWINLLQIIAAVTMTVGNITAIEQKSVKRLLAYSSISHAGVMMMGVLTLNKGGASAVLFYGVNYLFMTLVAFLILNKINNQYGEDHRDQFSGLIYRHPLMCLSMCVTLFSLTGLPPFGGFIAKFHIFRIVIAEKYYMLALIAGINSVISLYYYMSIVRKMILREPNDKSDIKEFGFFNQTVIVILTIPIILLGIFWEKLMILSDLALLNL